MAQSDAGRFYDGPQLLLATAIDSDDPQAIDRAIAAGAAVNIAGTDGVSPLMYSLTSGRLRAAQHLLKIGADPNAVAENGHSPVTLAVLAAAPKSDKGQLQPNKAALEMLRTTLQSGGNPDTSFPDGGPILEWIIGQHNPDAIEIVAAAGANLNAKSRTGEPLVISAGLGEFWDAVWVLIQQGADWRIVHNGMSLPNLLSTSGIVEGTPPHKSRETVRKFLIREGIVFPPPTARELQFANGHLSRDGKEVK